MASRPAAILLLLLVTAASAADRLESGQSLNPGESLTSGVFSLVMQTDCDLVLYASGSRVWYIDNWGSNCVLRMQSDGNLVIYSDSGATAVWASNSRQPNTGAYQVILQLDRNIVIYDQNNRAIWASDTSLGK